jgi:prepilin-type N-terminal cleavage/methylation domain-containing protein
MRRPTAGFTLLELLIALLVVAIGLLGFAGTLGPAAALAGDGRSSVQAAVVLASRLDRLRVAIQAAAPSCLPPAPGQELHPGGVTESWRAEAGEGLILVRLEAVRRRSRGAQTDSVVSRIPCP